MGYMRRVVVAAAVAWALTSPPGAVGAGLAAQVDTTMGTDEGAVDFGTGGGAGATLPGATAPFGMVQFSPDTSPSATNFGGGYSYPDTQLRGFSLTHLSGAGCAGLGDLPLLPTNAAVTESPAVMGSFDIASRYRLDFTHDGEVTQAGDYRVRTTSQGEPIDAQLTATTRTAAARFEFPQGTPGSILFNAGGSSMGNFLADLRVDPDRREVSGTVTSGSFCLNDHRYAVHMVARFDRPFAAHGTWKQQTLTPGGTRAQDQAARGQVGVLGLQYKPIPGGPREVPGNPSGGAQAGAYVTFDPAQGRDVDVRVGLSLVSVDGARRNLEAEAVGRSFETLRDRAVATWNEHLGRARVRGGDPTQRRLYTTMLYHALVTPNVVSDVDGQYPGLDGRTHTATDHEHLSNISGWDIYRTQVPLLAMIAPDRARDLARTLLADHRDSGQLPKWPVLGSNTNIMVGDPADQMLAAAHAFGTPGIDLREAVRATVDGATTPGTGPDGYVQRPGLEDYLRVGYVGHERNTDVVGHTVDPSLVWGSAATTLEYAGADFAIARLAAAAGDRNTCTTFATRSAQAWRNVLDPQTRYARPRFAADGRWADANPASETGFVEGSAGQYTWAVPWDVAGLAERLGGREETTRRLTTFLSDLNAGPKADRAFLGNEPTLHVPALASWLGRPDLGQAATRRALLELYRLEPGGFPGNDDLGTMSAWWVLNALGLQPVIPGSGTVVLGAPLFPRADVRLGNGRLTILAPRATAKTAIVRGLTFDGARHRRTWLDWGTLARGGVLRVAVGEQAANWARTADAAPPSFGSLDAACGAEPTAGLRPGGLRITRVALGGDRFRLSIAGRGTGQVESVRWRIGSRSVTRRTAPFTVIARLPRHIREVRAIATRGTSERARVLRRRLPRRASSSTPGQR